MKQLLRQSLAVFMFFTFLFTTMVANVCVNACIIETQDNPLLNESPAETIFIPHPFPIRHHYRRDEDI